MNLIKIYYIWAATLFFAACQPTTPSEQATAEKNAAPAGVITSTSMMADLVKTIAGDKIEVSSIIANNQSTHDFSLKTSDLMSIKKSTLFFVNGLGLDDHLAKQVSDYSGRDKVVTLSEGWDSADTEMSATGSKNANSMNHDEHSQVDPHLWLDPVAVKDIYIPNIQKALIRAYPEQQNVFEANAKQLQSEINAVYTQAQIDISQTNRNQIHIAVPHQAFSHFGQRFNLQFHPMNNAHDDDNRSAKDTAAFISILKRTPNIIAFTEVGENDASFLQITKDQGIESSGELYADKLIENPSIEDTKKSRYLITIQKNITMVIESLKK